MKTSKAPKKTKVGLREPKAKKAALLSKPASAKRKLAAKPVRAAAAPARRSAPGRPRAKARPQAASGHPPIYYRLHALLHTVRAIGSFEDQLAGLLHEAGHAGALGEDAREELHTLLLDMPSSSYHAELDALHEALHSLSEQGLTGSGTRRA